MPIRPLHDRILVRRASEETKTSGGILLPTSAQEKPMKGEVVSAGNGKILKDGTVRSLDVKVGETVIFGKYSGTEIKVDEEDLLIMREEDVMAISE